MQYPHVGRAFWEPPRHDQLLDVGDIVDAPFQLPRLAKVDDPNEEGLLVPLAVVFDRTTPGWCWDCGCRCTAPSRCRGPHGHVVPHRRHIAEHDN